MKLIKAGTSGLNAEALIAKSEFVEKEMTGNTNFTTPNPSIATVKAAREALATATAQAESRATADIAVRNQAKTVLSGLLANLARYVNNVSAGNVDAATSSGFELAKKPTPVSHLEPPVKLQARVSNYEGALDLKWQGVEGARMYQVYINEGAPSDPSKWSLVAVSSRTKITITDLAPGTFYSFRVTALGRIGEGPASEVVSRRAA